MRQYKVKAYKNGILKMQVTVTGRRIAEAAKRVYIKDHHFEAKEIDIIKL